MNDLAGKHFVLGLSGGIACYKAAELCRALIKEGATVQVVMTEAAEQFITPVTMQALSGRPVYGSQWDSREPNNMPHINLSREADAIIRGLRALSDFEFEFNMALMNRHLEPRIETLFVMRNEQFSYTSSSLVKQVARYGGDVSNFVPADVAAALKTAFAT